MITNLPDTLSTYEFSTSDSGNTKKKTFCKTCGSSIYVENLTNEAMKGILIVPMGILEKGAGDLNPAIEFYCARRVKWFSGILGSEEVDRM